MSSDIADRYLRTTRFAGVEGPLEGTLPDIYRGHFDFCRDRLELDDAELWITHSANQRVETLYGARRSPLVIYDQFLGQTFNRLTRYMLVDPGTHAVVSFALERIALELAALGARQQAAIAAAASLHLAQAQATVGDESDLMRSVRSVQVGIQEFFVIAHECTHIAILDGRLSMADSGWLDVVKAAAREFDSRTSGRQREVIQRAMTDHLAVFEDDGKAAPPELRDAVEDLWADVKPGNLANRIETTPHLAEELFCDHFASLLALRRFAPADERVVFPSVLIALHNLSTREYIYGLARRTAGNRLGAKELEAAARKSIFRSMSLFYLEAEGKQHMVETVHGDFISASERHAATVGDRVLFRMPYELDLALKRADDANLELDNETVDALIIGLLRQPPPRLNYDDVR